jgi:hypothetical protein
MISARLLIVISIFCGPNPGIARADDSQNIPLLTGVKITSAPRLGISAIADSGQVVYREEAFALRSEAIISSPIEVTLRKETFVFPAGTRFGATGTDKRNYFCLRPEIIQQMELRSGSHCMRDTNGDGLLDAYGFFKPGKRKVSNKKKIDLSEFKIGSGGGYDGEPGWRQIRFQGIEGNLALFAFESTPVLRAKTKKMFLASGMPYFDDAKNFSVGTTNGSGLIELDSLVLEFTITDEGSISYVVRNPFGDWANISADTNRFEIRSGTVPIPPNFRCMALNNC